MEVFQEQVDMLTIDRKKMTIESFLQTKPVSIQRFEQPRHKKVMSVLNEKLLPTHLEVALVKTNFTDNYYKQGEYYSINGNTRKFIWENYPETRPNQMLYVTIYFADTREDVEAIYRSIDSENSVEKVKDMMSGIFRDTSFEPLSRYINGGKFITGLRHAYACMHGNRNLLNYTNTPFNEIKNKKEFTFFENELKFLDEIYASFQGKKDVTKRMNVGSVFSALLIICKKYGTDNPKVKQLIDNLINKTVIQHEGVGGLNDGASVIFMELYDKYENVLQKWSDISAGFGPVIIGNILYCMEEFVNDKLIKINNITSTKGVIMKDDKIKQYFEKYMKL